MRKVKLLALLLAVLMVVTAFAGCANTDVIESDVANLDERVTALENLLNGIDKEIDDLDAQIKDLGDKIDSDKTADEVAALQKQLEEQKKALEEQKAAAQAAKDAADAAAKAAKDAADAQAKANADLLKQIQELMKAQEEAEKEAAKVLADAKTAALAKIATREAGLAGKYADLVAAAKAAVNAATTANACDKAVTDLEAAIVAADAAAGAAVLAAAQKTASEEIAVIREQKASHKDHFFKDEYELIVKALAAADTNVAAAKTAAEVDAAVETLETELAKYTAIDEKLYGYFEALWGNLTEANRAVNTEAQEYIKKAELHYINHANDAIATEAGSKALEVKALYAYVYGVGEDGKDLIVDLPYMLDLINDVYEGLAHEDVTFTKMHDLSAITSGAERVAYSALINDVETYSLAKAVAEAAKLDARVNDFTSSSHGYKETWVFLRNKGDNADTFGRIHVDYTAWAEKVKPLAEENLALVTTTAKIERIKGIVDNYMAAEKALVDLGEVNYKNQNIENVFAHNGWGPDSTYDGTNNPFYNTTTKKSVTETVFKPIDAKVDPWAEAYKLSAADKADIINFLFFKDVNDEDGDTNTEEISTVWNYANYLVDKSYVADMDAKFVTFKSDVLPLIKEMNVQTAIEVDTYDAYDALVKGFNSWLTVRKQTLTLNKSTSSPVKNVPVYTYVNDANVDLMVELTGIKNSYVGDIIANLPLTHKTNISGTNYGSYVGSAASYKDTALGIASTQLYYTGYAHTDFNPGYGSLSTIKLASDDNILKLVTFNDQVEAAGKLRTFLAGDYKTYNNAAKAIKIQIDYLADVLSKRQYLYSNLPILALEGKTVWVAGESVYLPLDHNALTVKDKNGTLVFAEGAGYEHIVDKYTSSLEADLLYPNETTPGSFYKGTSTTKTDRKALVLEGEPLTIKALEDLCLAKGYKGLAERLLANNSVVSGMESLKSAFAARITELKTNGADAFTTAVKAIGFVKTKTQVDPGERAYDTAYGSGDRIFYVTLDDEAKYQAAYDIFYKWVGEFGGNSKYENAVSKKFDFTVDRSTYTYQDGITYQSIFGANIDTDYSKNAYDIFANISAQMGVLTKTRDQIVKDLALLQKAMSCDISKIPADYSGTPVNVFAADATKYDNLKNSIAVSELITRDVPSVNTVSGYETLYTWKELSLDANGHIVETEFKDQTTFAPQTTITLWAMIESLSADYNEFELLNANRGTDGKAKASTSELYLVDYNEGASWKTIEAAQLAYVKAHYINELVSGTSGTDEAAAMLKVYLNGVADSSIVVGITNAAVQNWVEQMKAANVTLPAEPVSFSGYDANATVFTVAITD